MREIWVRPAYTEKAWVAIEMDLEKQEGRILEPRWGLFLPKAEVMADVRFRYPKALVVDAS